ncbi:hypothetical protein [Kitasatospora sp. NPDC087314]|uniref:hypothetical protein n=1 Tax=Kitasatospora sp. NPDC087314 TaxID=3364068 RepID=UPI003829B90F
MSRSRTDRSPARRVLAVCALTGGALLTAVTGGQAWADGTPTPTATPSAAGVAQPAAPGAAVATPSPSRPATPPAPSAAVQGSGAAVASPTAQPAGSDAKPQVREVPKGAAQAGDGSGETDGNGLMLAGGGGIAAVGAAALGFAILRRRSGARG